MLNFKVLLVLLPLLTNYAKGQEFTNPILDRNSADPCIFKLGNYYYLTLSENRETELTIFKSPIMTDFRNAESIVAFTAPSGFSNLWASEMHAVNGELYIYFTMDNPAINRDHRMFVIKANNGSDPFGGWSTEAIRLMPEWDYGAIDGTVLKHGNGKLYFSYASTASGKGLSLYMAEMLDPVTIGETKLLLRTPEYDWEISGGAVTEGPFFIYNQGVSYLIYSGSSTWSPDYCLGMMSIDTEGDPMNPDDWWYGGDQPVFWRNDEESVYTTGHAAFTVSPDGTETWMVYHGTVNTTHIDGYRIARLEKISWGEDGKPEFPRPHGYNHPQPVPSGQLY